MSLNISLIGAYVSPLHQETSIPKHALGAAVIPPLDPREARWRNSDPALSEMNEKSLEQNGLGLTPETDPDLLPAFIQQHFWSASYVLGKAPGDGITKSNKARPLPYKSPP